MHTNFLYSLYSREHVRDRDDVLKANAAAGLFVMFYGEGGKLGEYRFVMLDCVEVS